MYGDDANTDSNPNHIAIKEKTFEKGDKFEFQMASGGGMVIKLKPVSN